MTKSSFWHYEAKPRPHEIGFYWAETMIAQMALETSQVDHEYTVQGNLKGNVEDLVAAIEKLGVKLFYRYYSSPSNKDDYYFWVNDISAFWLDITTKNGAVILCGHSLNKELIDNFRAICDQYITRAPKRGSVYVLLSSPQGLQLKSLGVAGEDFIESNYRPEVVEAYRHVVADLNSNDPCGRIIILDGVPGTGKTHCVRALLNEANKATFVMIPSNMVSSLGSPDFLGALIKEHKPGHPLVLILEDADEALSSRKADNISAISALLNFSDGIFGAMLDIRIVCTTNIDIGDLDKAVMRDGRLCRRIEVGQLDHEQAEAVYKRLTGKDSEGKFTNGNFYPLGTVYALAKGGGGSKGFEVKKARGRIGFAPTPDQKVLDRLEEAMATLDKSENEEDSFWDREGVPTKEELQEMVDKEEYPPGTCIVMENDNGVVGSYVVGEDGQVSEIETPLDYNPDDDDDLIDEDPDDDDYITKSAVIDDDED